MYKDLNSINSHVTDTSAINNSIKNILTTRRGSVPGNPKFGSDLYKLLFSHLDTAIELTAKNMIFEALSEFEDRISIEEITIKRVEEYNKIVCVINYKFRDEFGITTDKVSLSL